MARPSPVFLTPLAAIRCVLTWPVSIISVGIFTRERFKHPRENARVGGRTRGGRAGATGRFVGGVRLDAAGRRCFADGEKNAWAAYHRLLREVPQQAGFPQSIDWPKARIKKTMIQK